MASGTFTSHQRTPAILLDASFGHLDEDAPWASAAEDDDTYDTRGSLYAAALEDPEAFGLTAELLHCLGEGDDEADDDDVEGDQHNAHVVAYEARLERCRHLASLTRGLLVARRHLDGSPGCTRMGWSEAQCHPPGPWSTEDEIMALPFEPMSFDAWIAVNPVHDGRQVRYPSCTLPWWGWSSLSGRGNNPLLFACRIFRANGDVWAQIAAAGGLDDDHGWLCRPAVIPSKPSSEWLKLLLMPPSERAAVAKEAKREKRTTDQRQRRAEARQRPQTQATTPTTDPAPKVARAPRPPSPPRAITLTDDGKALVPLTQGYSAMIAAADVPLVDGHRWHVVANKGKAPFAMRSENLPEGGKTRSIRMHRLDGLTGPVVIVPPPPAAVPHEVQRNPEDASPPW
ncbi:hypothetical protein V5F53_16695 [Xanthobacter sp. V4C-4]|uniref:hypothetical protein n=1 Tax=Xanthobacter cornucopiae TaxID=3119924 RepID=UPI00372B1A06